MQGVGLPNADNVEQQAAGVQALTDSLLAGNAQPQLASIIADAWSQAPFNWPPSYSFSLQECPLGMAALSVGQEVSLELGLYYQHFNDPQPPIDRSFAAALPHINWTLPNITGHSRAGKSWISWLFHAILGVFSVDPSDFLAFFTTDQTWSLQWIIESSLKCDASAVLTCSGHKVDLVMSICVWGLLYVVILVFSQGIGFPWLSTAFFLAGPSFVLW